MDFVDRKKEIARLKRALDSEKKRFIVIYGRRRLERFDTGDYGVVGVDVQLF